MRLKLLYHGPLWEGSTSLQRAKAFARLPGVEAIFHDTGSRLTKSSGILHRIRWKLRWPVDVLQENKTLLEVAERARPHAVMIDNSKVIARKTLSKLRSLGVRKLVYYTPDDIVSSHNLSIPLKRSFPDWDIVFTTKTFNIPELKAMGVSKPILIGKAFDEELHVPLSPEVAGKDFEKYDVVFAGAYEQQRSRSINVLAEAGCRIAVYGSDKGGWRREHLSANIALLPSRFAFDYTIALHSGKVAVCFLRKINRDRITQRTMEIAAMGRPMVAEKTDEHDLHFVDGIEYLGFRCDRELVCQVRTLLTDSQRRLRLGDCGRNRCLRSGYSTGHRALEMISYIQGEGGDIAY